MDARGVDQTKHNTDFARYTYLTYGIGVFDHIVLFMADRKLSRRQTKVCLGFGCNSYRASNFYSIQTG